MTSSLLAAVFLLGLLCATFYWRRSLTDFLKSILYFSKCRKEAAKALQMMDAMGKARIIVKVDDCLVYDHTFLQMLHLAAYHNEPANLNFHIGDKQASVIFKP